MKAVSHIARGWLVFALLAVVAVGVYRPGLDGPYLFDDFPNIVDNAGVKPADTSLSTMARIAMSSPASEFKRPLASLSFAANYLATGLDPFWMKVTNLVIHLLNGWMAYLVARLILRRILAQSGEPEPRRADISAALVAGAWLLLPINVTAVLYVVQRMESLANLFVLIGLLGYLDARQRMQARRSPRLAVAATISLIVGTCCGLLAKETAVMLPLYAFVAEYILFKGRSFATSGEAQKDRFIPLLFAAILWIPMCLGLVWLLPGLLRPSGWSTRAFNMSTRLLTEGRVVLDYVGWTLTPWPSALSFYHDDLAVSKTLFDPWSTLPSIIALCLIAALGALSHRRLPAVALGLGLFFACHLLTGTILPLELVYEHRNYFASFGLALAVVPILAQPRCFLPSGIGSRLSVPGPAILLGFLVFWTGLTALTSHAWRSPLSLANELAARAPRSPRAQYELGRTYVILSRYDAASPYAGSPYAPLEQAAALPESGILPEQALIFYNARMKRTIRPQWWQSMAEKLLANKVTVQDESALGALSDCMRQGLCDLDKGNMEAAFLAALHHPRPSARLLAMYSDFAWNSLDDRTLAVRMSAYAVDASPRESEYRVGLVNKLLLTGQWDAARHQREILAQQNFAGSLDGSLERIDSVLAGH